MKHIFFILFTLSATSGLLMAKHVPKRVMLHYCTEVAAAQYDIPLQRIDTQMPIYKKGGFVVHGKIRRPHKESVKFTCRYDEKGKFEFIKKHPQHNREKIRKRIKHACKGEASVRWRVEPRDIKITNIQKMNENRFKVTLDGPDATGTCLVNKQGHIYRFETAYKQRYVPSEAKYACMKRASLLWNLPAPFIRVEHSEYLGQERYLLDISGALFQADCEVSGNGTVLHFDNTRYRR